MNNLLHPPVLECSILLPGLLLAYLPMKQHLRMRPGRLAVLAIPLALFLCTACGSLCYFLNLKVRWMLLPMAILSGIFYIKTLNVSYWKSVSVFLAVCAVFSCLGSIARAVHGALYPGTSGLWLSPQASLLYVLLCWGFVLIAWYPAAHAARDLVEDEAFAQTWYVFWILPLLFIGLNLFMVPIYPDTLQQGRILQGYLIVSIVLLILLLLFYFMFYLMAASLNKNDRLRQENLFLSMQQAQYGNLKTAVSETREARHDMRHHFHVMQGLAERNDWDALSRYLQEVQDSIPDAALNLCENSAVDAIASHYALLCKRQGIPCSLRLDLPEALPVAEIDFCLSLSNLLENALEASLRTDPKNRYIRLQARLHSQHIILLTVENAYQGKLKEKNGVFSSSKHSGSGIGTQSVRRIAEKNGGYCRYSHENGIFRADVLLRGSI